MQTDINDKPPNPDQPAPQARMQPRRKPWEREGAGSVRASAGGSPAGTVASSGTPGLVDAFGGPAPLAPRGSNGSLGGAQGAQLNGSAAALPSSAMPDLARRRADAGTWAGQEGPSTAEAAAESPPTAGTAAEGSAAKQHGEEREALRRPASAGSGPTLAAAAPESAPLPEVAASSSGALADPAVDGNAAAAPAPPSAPSTPTEAAGNMSWLLVVEEGRQPIFHALACHFGLARAAAWAALWTACQQLPTHPSVCAGENNGAAPSAHRGVFRSPPRRAASIFEAGGWIGRMKGLAWLWLGAAGVPGKPG